MSPEKFPQKPENTIPPVAPDDEFVVEHEEDPRERASMFQEQLGTNKEPSGAYTADWTKLQKAGIEREAGGLDVQTTLQNLEKKNQELASASFEDQSAFYSEAVKQRAVVSQEAVKHEYLKLRNKALYNMVKNGKGAEFVSQTADKQTLQVVNHDLGQLIEMIKVQKPKFETQGDTAKAKELADVQMKVIQLKEQLDMDLAA